MQARLPAAALLAAMTLAAPSARGQVAPYQVFTDVVPYVGLGAGAVEFLPGLGDASTRALQLPFDLTLYGETFNTVYVNANGVINVTSSRSGLNFPAFSVPSSVTPNGFVAALWDDWCSSVTGCPGAVNPGVGVYYEIDDTVPGQGRLSIEWRRLRHFSDTQAPSDVSFSLTWYEGPASQVELHYGPVSPGIDFSGGQTRMEARIGLENAAGALGMWLAPCAGPTACTTSTLQGIANTRITLLADAGEDVTITNVSVPEVGYPGLPLPVTARLASRHQNPLGPLTWAAYLVPATASSTTGATPLFTSAPVTLAGFESRPLTLDLAVPADLPRGQYRVALVADAGHALAETDEANNLAWALGTVRIADRAPDLRVDYLRPSRTDVRPGQTVAVDYRVTNAGNRPGPLELQFFLSSNRAITTADLDLGPPTRIDTVAGQVIEDTAQLTLPNDLQTGLYYLGILLDADLDVAELDESNNAGRTAEPLIVAAREVEIVTEALPPATLGRPYSVTLQSAGGDGRYAYEITAGYQPRGLAFDEATGTFSGVPLQPVSVDVTFEVTSGRVRGSKTLTLVVLEPDLPLTLVTLAVPDAAVSQDYAARLYAVGGTWPYRWSVRSGALPPGLGMSPDGDVFGTPLQAGNFPVAFEVRDFGGGSVTSTVSLRVRPPPNLTITTRTLPAAVVGEAYNQTLFASGGIRPLTWRRITVPPPGLIVTPEGRVQGTPEQVGRFRFVVEVTDDVGNVDTNELALDVDDEGRFEIVTESLPFAVPGEDFRAVVRAARGEPPYTWDVIREEGRLPAGFLVEPGRGVMAGEGPDDLVITGQPEREGVWPFRLEVIDRRGRVTTRTFAVVSRVPPPEPVADSGCLCLGLPRTGGGGSLLLLCGSLALLRRRRDR